MARGIYFSGDLAAINDAMASEEANRIRGRSSNQSFLAALAGESTRRRGQDVEERMGQQRNQALFDTTALQTGSQDRATAAQLDAARLLNERELGRIAVDKERIAALERDGLRVDSREKARLEQAAKQAEATNKNLLAISLIQAMANQGRMDPRTGTAMLEANLGIQEQNRKAKAAAEAANLSARGKEWAPLFGEPEVGDFAEALAELPEDLRSLVRLDQSGGTSMFMPRLQQPIAQQPTPGRQVDFGSILQSLLGSQAPSIATPPINQPTNTAPVFQPPTFGAPIQRSGTNRVIPAEDIIRSLRLRLEPSLQ